MIAKPLIAAAFLFATAAAAHAAPDLAPIPSRIAHGVISVRNVGPHAAPASIVTVQCNRVGQVGGCADHPDLALYANPAYPNKIAINVPALAPGRVHNFTLPFWDEMVWAPGNYRFRFRADAASAIAEANEGNNSQQHILALP